MKKFFYIDSFGNTVSEQDALDSKGMLRDGFGIRQPVLLMDSAPISISDAAAWASTPAGASVVAREAFIADLNRRPARSAEELFRDSQASQSRHNDATPLIEAQAATAALMAREAREQMIAHLTGGRR